jgi:hypothetical protein
MAEIGVSHYIPVRPPELTPFFNPVHDCSSEKEEMGHEFSRIDTDRRKDGNIIACLLGWLAEGWKLKADG